MRKEIIYKLGCLIGGSLFFFSPIANMVFSIKLKIWNISLAAVGALILGTVFLVSYYQYKTSYDKFNNWWMLISGVFFVAIFGSSFLPVKWKAIVSSILITFYLIVLYTRKNQLEEK